MNLYNIFCQRVLQQPDHIAFIDPSKESCSYKALQERIDQAAQDLKKVGVLPKTCIGLHCESSLQYIVWAYAIWKCEAVIVPIALELTPIEKTAICKEIHLSGIVSLAKSKILLDPIHESKKITLQDGFIFISIKEPGSHPLGFKDINAAFIRFSSGTTGNSKGVVLSHETVYERIHAANEALEISPSDTILWLLSMSYHFTVSIVAYLNFGATIVLCEDFFGTTIVKTAAQYEATISYASPFHYSLMAIDKSGVELPHLRLAISTTSSLKEEISNAFEKRFKISLSQAYGIIEIGLPCINTDKRIEKYGSVGRPLPAYQIRMRDIEGREDLKSIDFKGKGMVDAYYSPWQMRNEIMPDGWLSTGDLGKIDDDGFLYILGRSKEMINVAGMKVFPQEIEAVLESHPAVKEACVSSYKQEPMGEVPHARIILNLSVGKAPSEGELKKYCLKYLTAFKVPEKIEYVNQLPHTASGKLIRHR